MRIYVSHSIRGKFGNDATLAQMAVNGQKALRFGHWLRENFSGTKFYIPYEMDILIRAVGIDPIDIVDELLTLDCAIIKNCDGMIVYSPDNYIGSGMRTEIDFAHKNFIPTDYVYPVDVWNDLDLPHSVGKQKIEHFIKELENEN